MSWSTFQNPPRPSYPKEMLKHRFLPVGAETPAPHGSGSMDVDAPTQNSADGEVKAKKRKVDGSSGKKSKKSKGAE